jgi:hypothetical protein
MPKSKDHKHKYEVCKRFKGLWISFDLVCVAWMVVDLRDLCIESMNVKRLVWCSLLVNWKM